MHYISKLVLVAFTAYGQFKHVSIDFFNKQLLIGWQTTNSEENTEIIQFLLGHITYILALATSLVKINIS